MGPGDFGITTDFHTLTSSLSNCGMRCVCCAVCWERMTPKTANGSARKSAARNSLFSIEKVFLGGRIAPLLSESFLYPVRVSLSSMSEKLERKKKELRLGVAERTLDPATEAEWVEVRELGHRMLDGMLDHIRGLRDLPAWSRPPERTKAEFAVEVVPRMGVGAAAAYESFERDVLPYGIGNAHPRFWGWVQGNGTVVGMLAEMLAAGMNPNVGGFDDSATMVEEQVLRWLAELMGMPRGTSGLLTSGGSMANLLGLAVGRHARAGFDLREAGMQGGPVLRVYCSTETHSWLKKAAELMGMGRVSLCAVGVDSGYRMRVDELKD